MILSLSLYRYMLIECVVLVLWDMSVLAGLRFMTYILIVDIKGKHISDAWLGCECGWFWKMGMGTQPCILVTHKFSEDYSVPDLFIYCIISLYLIRLNIWYVTMIFRYFYLMSGNWWLLVTFIPIIYLKKEFQIFS